MTNCMHLSIGAKRAYQTHTLAICKKEFVVFILLEITSRLQHSYQEFCGTSGYSNYKHAPPCGYQTESVLSHATFIACTTVVADYEGIDPQWSFNSKSRFSLFCRMISINYFTICFKHQCIQCTHFKKHVNVLRFLMYAVVLQRFSFRHN